MSRTGRGWMHLGLAFCGLLGLPAVWAQTATVAPTVRTIAVLLPGPSSALGDAGAAVRAGIAAAAQRASTAQVSFRLEYINADDTAASAGSAFSQAQEGSTDAVIGPLSRNAVNAVATLPVKRPTVLLNMPDTLPFGPVLAFSLAQDAQARWLAQPAFDMAQRYVVNRRPHALIVVSPHALWKRTAQGFAERFSALGGTVQTLEVTNATLGQIPERLKQDKQDIDTCFIATDGVLARAVRPFLPRDASIWSTGEINLGDAVDLADINGTRFADMPWLLWPDHPAVMAYPRPVEPMGNDAARLYAFGIDAFRLAMELVNGQRRFELDGVTGRLNVDMGSTPVVVRTPALGVVRDGHVEMQ